MKSFYTIQFLLICFCSFSQKQANMWYFGNGAGLDFNGSCAPVVLTNGQINGFEGCLTMSHKTTGQLLFYTNSERIWNSNHQVIPNSTLIPSPGNSITQVLALERPASGNKYYIFTLQVQSSGQPGLKLAELDLSLNGGLGGILFKDSLICTDTMSESITAIKHANGNDIWVVAHKSNSDKYLSYSVTPTGVSVTPVISAIGKRRRYNNFGFGDDIGEMKASPNGNKLASVSFINPHIELFDFNKNTGQVSNMIRLPEMGGVTSPTNGSGSGLYGISFSSNNRFMYVTKGGNTFPNYIIQYDITSNDSATINNSRVTVATTTATQMYSLKLAPNKKIYVGMHNKPYIGVINFPDSVGLNCGFVEQGINLLGKISGWGLNNLMEYGEYCSFNIDTKLQDNLNDEIKHVNIFPNPFSDIATIKFPNPDYKTTKVNIYNHFGQLIITMEVNANEIKIEKSMVGSGLFYFSLITEGKTIEKGKFFVE